MTMRRDTANRCMLLMIVLQKRRCLNEKFCSTSCMHAPFLSEVAMDVPNDLKDTSPGSIGSLKSLAPSGDSWAVLSTGGSSANHVRHCALPPAFYF
jgi:hypothetical protein